MDTQAEPGGRWWSGRKSGQGLAGSVSGPVHHHAHTIKHPGVALAVAHQVQALPRRGLFDMALSPWFRADLA